MFERYTEQARRLVFFARYEAAQLNSASIDTEHLLLGLLREGGGAVGPVLHRAGVSPTAVRQEIEARIIPGHPVSTSVDIPLSSAAKRALQQASSEAERLGGANIGTEHVLLGLLADSDSMAGQILQSHGLRLDEVREDIRLSSHRRAPGRSPSSPFNKLVDFVKQLEARRAQYHLAPFRDDALRVEIAVGEERWAVTFFADGTVTADAFWLSSGAQDEGSLPKLLERLGPGFPPEQ